jgi:hypothetical protein
MRPSPSAKVKARCKAALHLLDQGVMPKAIALRLHLLITTVEHYGHQRRTIAHAPLEMAPKILGMFKAKASLADIAAACDAPLASVAMTLMLRFGDAPVAAAIAEGMTKAQLLAMGVPHQTVCRVINATLVAPSPRLILRAIGARSVAVSADDTPAGRISAAQTMRAMLGPDAQWREVAA